MRNIGFLNKANIKIKLGFMFVILISSISVLSYKAIDISEKNKNSLKFVHSTSQEVLELQDKVITPLYRLRELTQTLVMAPNVESRKSIIYTLDALIEILQKEFEKLNNESVLKHWEEYKSLIFLTRRYLNEGFEEGAYVNSVTSSRKQFHKLEARLLKMQSQFLNNATVTYKKADEQAKIVRYEILIILIVVMCLSTFLAWLITSNILNSIHKVQVGLKDFFKYLNHKTKEVSTIDIKTSDEFYQMATMINQNVSLTKLNIEQNEELIKNATKVLENIKGGNLGTRLSEEDINNESLNELKLMMNNMIDNLELRIQEETSKRVEQEQLLIQQSKLAAMGEMIGNIAHQWRQPLAQISAIHMNMRVKYDFNEFTKEYLKEKIKEANTLTTYMSQTITDFQNFFKPQGNKEEFSVLKACEDAYHILESSLKYYNVEVNFIIKEDTLVNGYKNEYSQVILNILSNAKNILIEREVKNPRIDIEIKTGKTHALVKIQDNAGGISKDIIDKIFDPYFTTRHKTQGTGIGLYMSKTIIERNMNGYINAENKDDGALFTIKVGKK